MDFNLSLTRYSGVVCPRRRGLFVVLEVERILCTIKFFEDWSGEAQVSFPEDKCYDDRYFTVFDDYIGVIARTGFRSFWRWLSRSPYMFPVLFTSISREIARPILDWLLDGLEQPAWIVYGEQSYGELWLDYGVLDSSSTPAFPNTNTDCLSTFLDNDFRWVDVEFGDESSANSIRIEEMVAAVNTVVVRAFPNNLDYQEITLFFPPWFGSRDSSSNLRVVLEDFLAQLSNSDLSVRDFLSLHRIGERPELVNVPHYIDQGRHPLSPSV